ncbi:cysteine-rich receptor-like protein kinase 2 [Dendrobium catenatum]|uniref:Cysteine-rich receptor-like protein kinase 42 n=1 Tax=Dendrobium catenatum TaxID=906689 RepID=A0A2I0VC44_9ASPA|nr:cysteine-rich receptor-like protein kinase 2 [Dendrobium catenatum]PKU60974.1 Cysteine-rich receptor-like protein kinase 42 [Dendrobium catenatum]
MPSRAAHPNAKPIQNPPVFFLDRMASSLPFLLFLFLLHFSTAASEDSTSPAIFRAVCGKSNTSDPEGFDVHFVDAMEKVFQNITISGFGTSVSGPDSNLTVYGLGQCFSYLSHVNCQLCYAQSRVKLPHCLPASTGRIYLDGCFLEYADRDVSRDSVDSADTFDCGNATFPNGPAPANLTSRLVGNLTANAYQKKGYYEVGSIVISSSLTVYAMAQCWLSLNSSGCRACLEQARDNLVGRCLPASSSDAKAMNAGCFMRYSTYPFYLPVDGSGGGSSSHVWIWVVVALTVTVVVLAVIGGAAYWRWRRSRNPEDEANSEVIRSISKSHLSFKYEDLCQATDNFSQNNKLGQGGYGSVYKGTLPDGREIAVKRLFFNTRQWVDQFFNEVTLINQVQHKNLVKLLGCSVEGPESLLVYEYLCNTSLDHYLFDTFKKHELDWERRFDIMLGTAEGLAYLHTASVVRIIHRDIKASNILLDNRFRAKISDFGLARYFAEDQSHLSTGLAGTFGYMAPEYIVHGQLTEKADIYSYGIVVLEIITGRKNQNSISTSAEGHSLMQQIWQHYNSDTLIKLLDSDLQGKCTEEEALNIFHVGLLCVQASPALRPPMWKVVEMLTSRSKELPAPSQPPFINIKGTDSTSRSESSETSYLLSSSVKSLDSGQASVNQVSVSIFQGR